MDFLFRPLRWKTPDRLGFLMRSKMMRAIERVERIPAGVTHPEPARLSVCAHDARGASWVRRALEVIG